MNLETGACRIHNPFTMSRPLETFAKSLKKLRLEKQLRQEDVADELNISRQALSKYERGEREPDYHMLIKLADYYEVSIDYLFGRTKSKKVNFLDDNTLDWIWPAKVADQEHR